MMKYNKYMTRLIMLSFVSSASAMASHEPNDNNAPLRQVAIRADKGLESLAKNLGYVKFLRDSDKIANFREADSSSIAFMKQNNANGIDAGSIVLDTSFEEDHAVKKVMQPGFKFDDNNVKKIAHGTQVMAAAASVKEALGSIACGATIYPMKVLSPAQEANILQMEQQIKQATEKKREKEKADVDKIIGLKAQARRLRNNGDEVAAKAVEDQVAELNRQGHDLLKEYSDQYNKLTNKISVMKSKPYLSTFDRIEEIIEFCSVNKLPIPHTISMSLSFRVTKEEAPILANRLMEVLKKHDLLFVTSAGNDGQENVVQYVGEIQDKDDGLVDFKNVILQTPELLKYVIYATAYFKPDRIAEYSTRAGSAKDHTLIADGTIFDTSTYNQDGSILRKGDYGVGTSLAAPRVAAAATVLKKYFPSLTMLQIKKILLDTAFKPEDHDEREIGQGALFLLAAWTEAVRITSEAAEAPAKKSKNIIGAIKGLLFKK